MIGGVEKYSFDLYNNLNKITEIDKISNSRGKKFIVFFAVFALVKTLINQRKYSVIHLSSGVLAPLGLLLKILTNKKIFVTVHGLDITWNNWFYQLLAPRCLKRMDKIICVSAYTGKVCEEHGIAATKIEIIPNGIDFENYGVDHLGKEKWIKKYHIDTTKKNIISVGRLIKRKGVKAAIENCFSKIKYENYHYFVVGNGLELSIIKKSINRLGLDDKISILANVEDKDLGAFYEYSDLFIMPNIEVKGDIEGFGIVCIEAGAHGLPVLTSGIQGIKDAVVQGKSGIVYKNYPECIKLLKEFLDGKSLFASKSIVKEFVKKTFSWKKIAQEYIKIYSE